MFKIYFTAVNAKTGQVMESENSVEWFDAMEDELKSMETNGVWELVELPEGCKTSVVSGYL